MASLYYKISGTAALRELGMADDAIEDFLASVHQYPGSTHYGLNLEWMGGLVRMLSLDIGSGRTSISMWIEVPRSPDQAAIAVTALPALLDLTTWPTRTAEDVIEWFEWDGESQSWRYGTQEHAGALPKRRPIEFVEQIWVGIAALWFLGKLAEGYVTRLGELMAETTVAALRRIRTTKSRKGQQVVIKVAEDVTVMMLPEGELTDEAKAAFIDLDPNADGIRGKVLSWSPESGAWLPQSDDTSRLPRAGEA